MNASVDEAANLSIRCQLVWRLRIHQIKNFHQRAKTPKAALLQNLRVDKSLNLNTGSRRSSSDVARLESDSSVSLEGLAQLRQLQVASEVGVRTPEQRAGRAARSHWSRQA